MTFDVLDVREKRRTLPQDSRAKQTIRTGDTLCPRRAFRACLALHAPRSLAGFSSILLNKTARPCVEHRSCHPNRVMFSNPSVAQGRLPRASIFLWAPFKEPCLVAPTSIARPSNHHPATEAEAVPFAPWLHKGESNSNQAADLSKLYPPPSLLK